MISSRWRDDRTTARLPSHDTSASSERVQLVHERATCQVGDRAGAFSVDGSTLDGAAIGSMITQSAVLRERPARVASVHGLGRCASQATTASAAPRRIARVGRADEIEPRPPGSNGRGRPTRAWTHSNSAIMQTRGRFRAGNGRPDPRARRGGSALSALTARAHRERSRAWRMRSASPRPTSRRHS